jgi:hypothetical protein
VNLRGIWLVVAIAPAVAHAQASPRLENRGWNAGLGAELGFGAVDGDAPDVPVGWAARLQFHAMPFLAEHERTGPLVDIAYGFEFWRAGHGNWGTDLPFELELGVRARVVRAQIGVGCDVLLLDQVHGDTGFGVYAPVASVTAGADIGPLTVMADARVTRRWQFGADDSTQWMFTLGVGFTKEPI